MLSKVGHFLAEVDGRTIDQFGEVGRGSVLGVGRGKVMMIADLLSVRCLGAPGGIVW